MKNKINEWIDKNGVQIFFLLSFLCINICEFVKNIYFLFAIGLCFLLYSIKFKIHFSKEKIWYILSIGGMILLLLFNHPAYHFPNTVVIKTIVYFLIMICLSEVSKFSDTYLKYSVIFGYIHVLATFLFLLFPKLYPSFAMGIYGYYPVGTNNGINGYTAGLTSHYSANALYITFCIFSLVYFVRKYKTNQLYKILLAFAIIALILTTKRAHILFSLMAIMITYFIEHFQKIRTEMKQKESRHKILKKILCFFIIVGIGIITLYVLFPDILLKITDRLKDGTSGRTAYWKKAFEWFLENPFLGIGWLQFGFRYKPFLFGTVMNTHNVYIQLLCECGIIGLTLFFIMIFLPLKRTIQKLLKGEHKNINYYLLIVQIFFILYCFTGNCIYDNTLFFYSIASGLGMCIMHDS